MVPVDEKGRFTDEVPEWARYPLGVAWAFIALVAQLVAYALVALLLKDFPKRINRGEMAAAVLAAAIHVSVGLLNSAAMNY